MDFRNKQNLLNYRNFIGLIFGSIFCAIFICVGIFFYSRLNSYDFVETNAVITRIDSYYNNSEEQYDVYVAYEYEGNLYSNVRISTYVNTMYEGKNITVYVDKDMPYHAELKGYQYFPLFFSGVGIVIEIFMVVRFLKCKSLVNETNISSNSVDETPYVHDVDNDICADDICNDSSIYQISDEWNKYYFKKDNMNSYKLTTLYGDTVYSITKAKHDQYIFKDEEDLISVTYKVKPKYSVSQDDKHKAWFDLPIHLTINDSYIHEYLELRGYSLYKKQGFTKTEVYIHGLGGNIGYIEIENNGSYMCAHTTSNSIDIISLVCFGLAKGLYNI